MNVNSNAPYNYTRSHILTKDSPVTHNRFGNASTNHNNTSASCPSGFPYNSNSGSCTRPKYLRSHYHLYDTQQDCENSGLRGAKTNGCQYVNLYPYGNAGYLPICDKGYTSAQIARYIGPGSTDLNPLYCYQNCPSGWADNNTIYCSHV